MLDPTDPKFLPRFMIALNLRLKKQIPGNVDYRKPVLKEKIAMIAGTVLREMGIHDYKVNIAIKPVGGGKAHMGITFKKDKPKIWLPSNDGK